jgi:transposase
LPRSPQYRPQFSAADLEKAREVVRRTSSRQDYVVRARIALLIAEQPLISNVEAARRVGVHENTIRHWRKVWCKEGFRVEIGKGRGQKPRFSPSGTSEVERDREGRGV